jgi:hypothetical protein
MFAGVSNLPAVTRSLSRDELAPYEGRYVMRMIVPAGDLEETFLDLRADRGQLCLTRPNQEQARKSDSPSIGTITSSSMDPAGRRTGAGQILSETRTDTCRGCACTAGSSNASVKNTRGTP